MHYKLILFIALLLFLAGGCASPPHQELQSARNALTKAYESGAPEFAPDEYHEADRLLWRGESLVNQGKYDEAREMFPAAEDLAQRSMLKAQEEKARIELAKKREEAARKAKAKPKEKTHEAKIVPLPKSKHGTVEKKETAPPTHYTVTEGEVLWEIAARKEVYGDAMLWPLLYKANRDQIKDPRQIYPGQRLSIPRKITADDKKDAREMAQNSDIFPLEELLKDASN